MIVYISWSKNKKTESAESVPGRKTDPLNLCAINLVPIVATHFHHLHLLYVCLRKYQHSSRIYFLLVSETAFRVRPHASKYSLTAASAQLAARANPANS